MRREGSLKGAKVNTRFGLWKGETMEVNTHFGTRDYGIEYSVGEG